MGRAKSFGKAGAAGAIVAALAASPSYMHSVADYIGKFEGKRNQAYPDISGIPTACYGETQGVHLGDIFTDEQCTDMLSDDLKVRIKQVGSLLSPNAPITPDRLKALLSFQYNEGHGTLRSTRSVESCRRSSHCMHDGLIIMKLNQGDVQGSCDAFLPYNKVQGKVVRGLDRRRHEERRDCLKAK